MYTPVLSVKVYPVAMGFNHDTAAHTYMALSLYNRLQKSTSSHLQLINCLEEKTDVKTKVTSKITQFHCG